ncbi:hypothetical protein GOP47_0027708 [Adiantum capillus-veneris]|nr:hypothetical protein GOP47_0027708 [Adiantum capillus-veneris]
MSSRVSCLHPSCNRFFRSQHAMRQHCKDSHPPPATRPPYPPADPKLQYNINIIIPNIKLDSSSSVLDSLQLEPRAAESGVACNDCGRSFSSTDSLHRHQWDSPAHTRVSSTRDPKFASPVRSCSQCGEKLASADDLEQHYAEQHPITEILKSNEDGTWQLVADRFRAAWGESAGSKLYDVARIFKVYNPGRRRKAYEEYREEIKQQYLLTISRAPVTSQNNLEEKELRNKVLHDGNELRRYHGTTVKCRLALPARPPRNAHHDRECSVCTHIDCGLCRILQKGFKLSKCKVKKFQRFGRAIYCSSVSSKASAYVQCSASPARSRPSLLSYFCSFGNMMGTKNRVKGKLDKVMMACRVLAGRPYHSTHNMQHLEKPPPGYDSVQGDPGVHLNYDELVLYDDRAILPDFIILYTCNKTARHLSTPKRVKNSVFRMRRMAKFATTPSVISASSRWGAVVAAATLFLAAREWQRSVGGKETHKIKRVQHISDANIIGHRVSREFDALINTLTTTQTQICGANEGEDDKGGQGGKDDEDGQVDDEGY